MITGFLVKSKIHKSFIISIFSQFLVHIFFGKDKNPCSNGGEWEWFMLSFVSYRRMNERMSDVNVNLTLT